MLDLRHLGNSTGVGGNMLPKPISHSMTHAGVTQAVKEAAGISEGFVRLSIGLEHPEDLMNDLTQAWKVAASVANLAV